MNRLKSLTALTLTAAAATSGSLGQTKPQTESDSIGGVKPRRPNIIYIMSDDHATQAISAYGHPISQVAPTPNIDRLAAGGMLFDRAYCGNSISGPSRAAILTGKHSHLNGFRTNGDGFDGTQQTLPKILGADGYRTAVIGKWHLQIHPTGFDYWKVLIDQGEYYNPDFIEMGDTIRARGYTTDIITDYAMEWIDQQRTTDSTQPFFLMLHHKAPHRNWQPAQRHLYLYDTTRFPEPPNLHDRHEGRTAASRQEMSIDKDMMLGYDLKLSMKRGSDRWSPEGWGPDFRNMDSAQRAAYVASYRRSNDEYHRLQPKGKDLVSWKFQRYMRDYCATVASVDENVGRLLDYLRREGLEENTIVVYTSDQSFYLGEHGWFDKRFMYEESMRMPLMVRYPAEIPAGARSSALVQNIDFAPTLLDYCGIDTPRDMQGTSFREVAAQRDGVTPTDWRKSLYYRYFENPGIHNVMQHAGVRTDRWKLIYFFDNSNTSRYRKPVSGSLDGVPDQSLIQPAEYYFELYDLKSDPTEMNNLYGKRGTQKITAELTLELVRLADGYGDKLPPCPELEK